LKIPREGQERKLDESIRVNWNFLRGGAGFWSNTITWLCFFVCFIMFNVMTVHQDEVWGRLQINRMGVLVKNFEKNSQEIPRSCFVGVA